MDTNVELSDNALKILKRRYLIKNDAGEVIETPDKMFRRVANNIAQADKLYSSYNVEKTEKQFYEIMASLEFLPNSPTLMNAGKPLQQLSGCFVLPVEDSIESIGETLKNLMVIHKSGGGTGFSFSRLRPKGALISTTKGSSSGPISFMKIYDAATEIIKKGGTRRGANMGVMRVDHPDILDFISCKADDGSINNFNISVAITDAFMRAAETNKMYDTIDPRTGKRISQLNAKDILNKIVSRAHKNGEPGIIFIDRLNEFNPTPHIGKIESTNPCGEQPLLPYESCNLGSINLSKFVVGKIIDYEKLGRVVKIAIHFLDNVIDMNKYPIKEIEALTKANRKIGLGVMGFADMLILLGIPYTSKEATEKAEEVMKFIQHEAKKESSKLANIRGVFPNWQGSIYNPKSKYFKSEKEYPDGLKLRNATVTTIAPTGSIGLIAGTSGGIEPLFAVAYVHSVEESLGENLPIVNCSFEKIAKERGFYSEELMHAVAARGKADIDDLTLAGGNINIGTSTVSFIDKRKIKGVPADIQKLFCTAHDVLPEQHLAIQNAFQKYTDNAVSKTVNLPNNATEDDVLSIYLQAYRAGCKGVTVYRDGSREQQVLVAGKTESAKAQYAKPIPRSDKMDAVVYRMYPYCGKLVIMISRNPQDPRRMIEIIANLGKAGGCISAMVEAIGRLVSHSLRLGGDPKDIIKRLENIRCPHPRIQEDSNIYSCPDAIAKALSKFLEENRSDESNVLKSSWPDDAADRGMAMKCPFCEASPPVVRMEGNCTHYLCCDNSTCGG